MESKQAFEKRVMQVQEIKDVIFAELRQVAKEKKLQFDENSDPSVLIDMAINFNYYRRVFEHGLGMILWYFSITTEHGEYGKIIEEIGLPKRKAQRLKRRAKFFCKYPNDFVRQLSGSKKDFLMRLPEDMLEGLEDEDGTLADDIPKEDIIRMPVKELESRIKKAVDGTTVALQQELETKSAAMEDMGKELQKLRSDNARLRDPKGRDTEKEDAILKYAVEVEMAVIRFIEFLEGSPVPDELKEVTTKWMDRFNKRLDELRPMLVDLAFPDMQGWQPDPEVLNRADKLFTPNGSDNETPNN